MLLSLPIILAADQLACWDYFDGNSSSNYTLTDGTFVVGGGWANFTGGNNLHAISNTCDMDPTESYLFTFVFKAVNSVGIVGGSFYSNGTSYFGDMIRLVGGANGALGSTWALKENSSILETTGGDDIDTNSYTAKLIYNVTSNVAQARFWSTADDEPVEWNFSSAAGDDRRSKNVTFFIYNELMRIDGWNLTKVDITDNPPTFSAAVNDSANMDQWENFTANITISDELGVDFVWFSTNNSDSWVNDTPISAGGSTSYSANISKNITQFEPETVCWKWWANDTTGQINSSDLLCFDVRVGGPRMRNMTQNKTYVYRGDVVKFLMNVTDPDFPLGGDPNGPNLMNVTLAYKLPGNSSWIEVAVSGIGSSITYWGSLLMGLTKSWLGGPVQFSVNMTDDDVITEIAYGDIRRNFYQYNLTVLNYNATQTTPLINSTSASNKTVENVTCWNQSTKDNDTADLVTNHYRWFLNGALDLSILTSFYPSINTTKGDDLTCEVTPDDTINNGTSFNTTSLLILNSEPVQPSSTPSINSSTAWNRTLDDVYCWNDTTEDNDSDRIVHNYKWYRNGVLNASRTIYDNDLVLWLPFDYNHTGNNETLDYSSYDNNGTVSNAAWTTLGKQLNAYEFDGVDDYVDLWNVLNIGTSDQTVSAWVKTTGQGYGIIAGKGLLTGDDAADGFGIYMGTSEEAAVQIRENGSTVVSATGSIINDSNWHFIVGTVDRDSATGLNIYVDGVLEGTADPTAFNGSNLNTGHHFEIGARETAVAPGSRDYFWNGTIDDVMIWNRSLSATEIHQLYLAGSASIFNGSQAIGGDNMTCEATPHDEEVAGNAVNSSSLWINRLPRISYDSSTVADSSTVRSSVLVNVTVNDEDNTTTIVDWNRSLVLWMRMDNHNSTHVFDNSSYNNHGNITRPAFTQDGKFGKAVDFNGVNDSINIPPFKFGEAFTISVWSKSKNYDAYGSLVNKKSANARENVQFLYVNNDTYFRVYSTDNVYIGRIANNTRSLDWIHFVVTYNGSGTNSSIKIYKNTIQVDDSDTAAGDFTVFNDSLLPIEIGTQNSREIVTSFNGTIDEVMIFNRVLSSDEILSLYNSSHYEHNFTDLVGGSYTFSAYSQDLAGQVNQTEERSVTVDANPNGVAFVGPTESNGTHKNTNYIEVNVSITSADDFLNLTFDFNGAISSFQNGSDNITNYGNTIKSFWINKTGLSDGVYTFNITVYDVLLNANSTENRKITIDSSLPTATCVSPNDDNSTIIYDDNLTLNCSASDAYLDAVNLTFYNISGDKFYNSYTEGINATIYNITSLLNMSGHADGTFTGDWCARDSSTDSPKLEDYGVKTLGDSRKSLEPKDKTDSSKVGDADRIGDTGIIDLEYYDGLNKLYDLRIESGGLQLTNGKIVVDLEDDEHYKEEYQILLTGNVKKDGVDIIIVGDDVRYLTSTGIKGHFIINNQFYRRYNDVKESIIVTKIKGGYNVHIDYVEGVSEVIGGGEPVLFGGGGDFEDEYWIIDPMTGGLNIVCAGLSFIKDTEAIAFTSPFNTSDNFRRSENFTANITITHTNLTFYWFSTNNTGSWVNDSPITTTGAVSPSVSKSINQTSTNVISWRYYANNTWGTINQSEAFSFTVQADATTTTEESGGSTGGASSPSGGINCTRYNTDRIKYCYMDGTCKPCPEERIISVPENVLKQLFNKLWSLDEIILPDDPEMGRVVILLIAFVVMYAFILNGDLISTGFKKLKKKKKEDEDEEDF